MLRIHARVPDKLSDMEQSSEEQSTQKTGKEWALSRSAQFGEAVARARKKMGLTAVELSNRTREIGYPITRATIAKIESNSRSGKFDVSEVVTLATALEIAPLDLIFPGHPDMKIQVVPRAELSSEEAWGWAWGDEFGHTYDQWAAVHRPRLTMEHERARAVDAFNKAKAAFEARFDPQSASAEFGWFLADLGSLSSFEPNSKAPGELTTFSQRVVNEEYDQLRELRERIIELGGYVEEPGWLGTIKTVPF